MADFNTYFPIEIGEEGAAYENVPGDNGGCTKYGLTLDDIKEYYNDHTKTCVDVQALDRPTAGLILKKLYWDYFLADRILNDSLAEFIVDGGLNQGKRLIAKWVQGIVGVAQDGVPGPNTLSAINSHSAGDEFHQLYNERMARYNQIVVNNPSQQKFLHGWINRINNIKFK